MEKIHSLNNLLFIADSGVYVIPKGNHNLNMVYVVDAQSIGPSQPCDNVNGEEG